MRRRGASSKKPAPSTGTPRSLTEIARACGLADAEGRLDGGKRKQLFAALKGRANVLSAEELRRGQKTLVFSQVTS